MSQESRTRKTFLNARVNLIFYFLTLLLSFFSRKIFLDILGADFVGLTGTLQTLLGFLNIVELGIGTAVGYVLYKPLFEQNQQKINEIISVFGYMYRWVGKIILIAGFILSLFLPLIFPNTGFELLVIFLAYYSFLTSSLIGYFINYRQTLLSADQKNYVVTAYFQTGNIIKTIIQMISAYYTRNYYLWIVIDFTFGIIYTFILNWKINKTYPWLKSNVRSGKELVKKYPEIIKLTKQVFVHKIGGLAQFQMTPFLIYAYISLPTVAIYNNYIIITDKLNLLLNNFLGSTTAGVGNLVAEGDKVKNLRVYWELTVIRFFISLSIIFSLYYVIPPFIHLWLGDEYLLSNLTLICILIIFALNILRGTTDQFINAHGLYGDVWAPIVEALIYFIVAIIGGYYYKLAGVLSGNIISLLIIIHIWKPYYLFKKGFNLPVCVYWGGLFKYLGLSFLVFYFYFFFDNDIKMYIDVSTWQSFILYSIIVGLYHVLTLFIILYLGTNGMKSFMRRLCRK